MSNEPRGSVTQQLRTHWPLAGVILIYVVLAIIYGFVTPPFEGPDEPQHFAYVTWLASGKGFPPQGEAAWDTPIEQEAGQTPLYYLLASLPARTIDLAGSPAVYQPNPYFPGQPIDNNYDNSNRALHPPAEQWPLQGEWLAFYTARLVTMLFGVLLIVGIYLVAMQVRPSVPAFATSSAALVALTPQVLFLSSVVSNDIPAAALGTVALVFLAGMIRRVPAPVSGLAFAAGLFIGLAAMVKINALLLVMPAAVTVLWLRLGAKSTFKQVALSTLLMGTGTLLVTAWWFLRTALLYGSPLGVGTHDYAPWVIADPESLASPFARWLEVGRFYWITLGWGTIRPDTWVYSLLFLFVLIAVIGLVLAAYRRWRTRGLAVDATGAILIMLAVTILANVVLLEVWMNRVIAPYGRLLFPSIAAITVFLILGWSTIHRRFPILPLLVVAGLAILAPFQLVRPVFNPQLATAEEVDALPPALGWRFGETADSPLLELITVEPERRSVENKDALGVRICWRILGPAGKRYVVLLHLVGPQNTLIAQRRSYPGRGLLHPNQWQPGNVFCDTLHMGLKAEWAPTMVYQLEIGLIDEESGKRLPAVDQQNNGLAATFVDQIRVTSPTTTEHVDFSNTEGAPIRLTGHELDPDPWRPGESYAYELDWAAATRLQQDYQVFLHLRDSVTGAVVAQADHSPLEGWYPTSWWPVGEIVHDAGQIMLPADLPAGAYDLVAGFYDLATLQPLGEAYTLDRVQVQP